MMTGLATTSYHAQDISLPRRTEFPASSNHESNVSSDAAYENMLPDRIEKNDGSPRSREAQQKQADDAKREIEREIGRKLTPKEQRQFHDHITGQGYGYHELVDEGIGLFGER